MFINIRHSEFHITQSLSTFVYVIVCVIYMVYLAFKCDYYMVIEVVNNC